MHVHISRHVQSLAFNGPNATPEQWLRLRDLLDRAVDAGLADPSALRFMVGHVQEGSFSPEYYFDLWEGRLAARLSQPASQPTANASQQTVRRSAARWHGAVLTAIERLRVGEIDASTGVTAMLHAFTAHGIPKQSLQELIYKQVLPAVADPLQRAALTHAFLRELAEFRTPCCRRLHCWNCHVSGGHRGLTCAQYQARRTAHGASDAEIISCPKCFVSLIKAEGCNAVVCPCGHGFNYAQRKLDIQRERCAQFETMLELTRGENQWLALLELAVQASTLANDHDPTGRTSSSEMAALAAAWLKLNTAGSERLSAHFEAVSCGRPMLVRAEGTHSEALATVAIVQNVVSPSTLWRDCGVMETDGIFAYEVREINGGSGKPSRMVSQLKCCPSGTMLTAVRAMRIVDRLASDRINSSVINLNGAPPSLELHAAAEWIAHHKAASKEVRRWEEHVASAVKMVAELANLSTEEVLGVDEMCKSLGVYRSDAVEVLLATRNVGLAQRILQKLCTPNRQQLLQAVLLRRSMMRLDLRPSSATSTNSTTSSSDAGWCAHTKQCDGDVDTFSLSSLQISPGPPLRVETGAMGLDSLVASAALSPVSAQHNDPCHGYSGVGGLCGGQRGSTGGGSSSGEARRSILRLNNWAQRRISCRPEVSKQVDALVEHLDARHTIANRLKDSDMAMIDEMRAGGMQMGDAYNLLNQHNHKS